MQQVVQEQEQCISDRDENEIQELSVVELAWVGGGTGSFDSTL